MSSISLILATIPVLLTLLGMVWKLASLATILTETNRQYREDLSEIREALAPLKSLPTLEKRLEIVEDAIPAITAKLSDFPRVIQETRDNFREVAGALERRVYRSEVKLGLTSVAGLQPPRPRQGSKPEIPREDDE